MVEAIEGLALEKPRVPVSAIYRELKEFAAKTRERLPSYPAVYRVVKAIPISLMTLAHSGSRMYCGRFDLVLCGLRRTQCHEIEHLRQH